MTKNNLKVVKSTKDQEMDIKEKNKALDWITSKVVLEPLSYSAAIPSLAISAAFTWTLTEFKKRGKKWRKIT